MMKAIGSRTGDAGPGLDGRTIACLAGFPAMDSRSGRGAGDPGAPSFEDNIVNCIVNNIKERYRCKKSAKYDLKKRADSLYRDRAKGEMS
jgi:hypothetical protein